MDEINRAKEIIEESHPLARVPFYLALPFLKPFKKILKRKREGDHKIFVDEEEPPQIKPKES